MEDRFEIAGHVHRLKAVLPVTVRDDLAVELPARVRWGLSLNEGEILAVDLEEWGEVERYRFHSYGRDVPEILDACADLWPYLEPWLKLPLGRMVAEGAVELPEAVAERLSPRAGGRLLLRAEVEPAARWFSLERDGEDSRRPELSAEASYLLRVEEGDRVTPPPDALRFLPPDAGPLRIPSWMRGCAWVHLRVRLSLEDVELHYDPAIDPEL